MNNIPPPPAPTPPSDIQVLRAERQMRIIWDQAACREYAFYDLRIACQCAACVDEHTGRRILNPALVDPQITIQDAQLVGNYALRITWSDGHNTGLYTWDFLRKL
ncbi:MAG: DUF971 domain-containing protein [Pirellulales bacterium]|nr:DUF971 domain-containing protein [Pirellulales bacterium]